jgi:hypothetical protein
LLLPETDIIGNAAFLAGIVPECEDGNLQEKSNFKFQTPSLAEQKKYTPIVYILEDVSPESRPAPLETAKYDQEAVVDLTAVTPVKNEKEMCQDYKPLKSFGISAFGHFVTSSLQEKTPCES